MFTKCQVVKECVRAQMWWTGNSVTVHHDTNMAAASAGSVWYKTNKKHDFLKFEWKEPITN